MQVIRNIKNYRLNSTCYKTVTIGNFDGLHKGHISIIDKLVSEAQEKKGDSILITFDPHPAEILVNNFKIELIQTQKQFCSNLDSQKVSTLIIEKFTNDYSKLTAEQFFNRIYRKLKFDKLLIGYDFKFGKDKLGDFNFLYEKSVEHKFAIEKIEPFKLDDTVVSSTRIRDLLRDGNISEANNFLGRKYCVTGKVIKGAGKGVEIGFPTMNLESDNMLFLKHGVYETNVTIEGEVYKSITNFGQAPTLNNQRKPILEVHLLSENKDCYGLAVGLEFCKFIRPEMKFSGIDELKGQIQKDINSIK